MNKITEIESRFPRKQCGKCGGWYAKGQDFADHNISEHDENRPRLDYVERSASGVVVSVMRINGVWHCAFDGVVDADSACESKQSALDLQHDVLLTDKQDMARWGHGLKQVLQSAYFQRKGV